MNDINTLRSQEFSQSNPIPTQKYTENIRAVLHMAQSTDTDTVTVFNSTTQEREFFSGEYCSVNNFGFLGLEKEGKKLGEVSFSLRDNCLYMDGLKSYQKGSGTIMIKKLVQISKKLGKDGHIEATASPLRVHDKQKLSNLGFYYKMGFRAKDEETHKKIQEYINKGEDIPISLNIMTPIYLTNEGIEKLKLLESLENFGVKKEDFELINKDGTFVVISNSSYFSSIIGLNGIQEKIKTRTLKNRDQYDLFDTKLQNLLHSTISKPGARIQLTQYCIENNLDFKSILTGGGCVISEQDSSFVGIKRTFGSSKDILEESKGTITHEGQHIKFNNYCREEGIEQNGNLKILNEVIAHCSNTKNNQGDIDFGRIFELMKDNENYFSVSGIEDKSHYILVLKNLIEQVKKEMLDKTLDDTMKFLIKQNYKNLTSL